jgi:hypothetical protein
MLFTKVGEHRIQRKCKEHDLMKSKKCPDVDLDRGVTKRRPLSWLTNSALVYEPKFGGMAIIDEIYTTHPYYGVRRMAKYLQTKGFVVGRKKARHYYQIMGGGGGCGGVRGLSQ